MRILRPAGREYGANKLSTQPARPADSSRSDRFPPGTSSRMTSQGDGPRAPFPSRFAPDAVVSTTLPMGGAPDRGHRGRRRGDRGSAGPRRSPGARPQRSWARSASARTCPSRRRTFGRAVERRVGQQAPASTSISAVGPPMCVIRTSVTCSLAAAVLPPTRPPARSPTTARSRRSPPSQSARA
jgi:hypothetical protein